MQTRITRVQHALVVLLATALAIGLLARPAPQNGRLHRALDELELFRAHFERASVERTLLDYAKAQGAQPLSAIAAAASGEPKSKSLPALQADASAAPVQPLATVRLATLADVSQFAKPSTTLPIGVPDVTALGRALSWRLRRDLKPGSPAAVLKQVELQPAQIDPADLGLETEVAQVQSDKQSAAAAVSDATRELATAELNYENRRKWKLPWKVVVKADEARKAAKAVLETRQRTARELETRYTALVLRAERSRQPVEIPPIPALALARVTIEQAGQSLHYEIPVAIAARDVPVQTLPGGDFRETQGAGLWDEVHTLDAERAIDAVRAHFNWHYRYVELSGIKLGGMTVLQLLPCVLPFLLLFSVWRMRAVAEVYNPFGMRVRGDMPRVGFGARLFDALVVVVLPLAAAGCAVASLMLVGQIPALPLLTSVVCLGLGVYTFMKLGELQTLMEEVVRSHSNPPPDDDS